MKLYGKLIKGTKITKEAMVFKESDNLYYRDLLEESLINLCKELDIPVPLWLKKNTKEFAAYRRTFFSKEQFVEKVYFDRFDLIVES